MKARGEVEKHGPVPGADTTGSLSIIPVACRGNSESERTKLPFGLLPEGHFCFVLYECYGDSVMCAEWALPSISLTKQTRTDAAAAATKATAQQ